MTAGLIILGFGGHARSVADVALRAGFNRLLFVDDAAAVGESFAGFAASADWPGERAGWQAFPASGDAEQRRKQILMAQGHGVPICTICSPSAYIGQEAVVEGGTFIAHRAHIGPGALIGYGTIINTAAVVDHEARVGDFSHVSINATLAGRCVVGNRVLIGAGATLIPKIRICDDVAIGAGAVVIRNIEEAGTYVGVPARRTL